LGHPFILWFSGHSPQKPSEFSDVFRRENPLLRYVEDGPPNPRGNHMKKLFLGCIAVAAFYGAPALAADMAVKAPPMASPLTPIFSWTGFYVGGNAGYGWKDPTVSYTPNDIAAFNGTCGGVFGGTCIPPASFDIGGAVGGIEAGYNWQFSQQWLLGFEADFDWSGIRGTGTSNFQLGHLPPSPSSFLATEEIKWFGTIRGRLGWLPTNNFLVYGTGGLAYGRVDANAVLNSVAGTNLNSGSPPSAFGWNCTSGPNCFVGSTSQTLVGWTAGLAVNMRLREISL
jgi:outer membrane immunogenic protein